MTLTETVSMAIANTPSLPPALRDISLAAMDIEESRFDASYLQFLDTQIRLAPRGPEWAAVLQKRRAVLAPLCDRPFLRAALDWRITLYIDRVAIRVIHWEVRE